MHIDDLSPKYTREFDRVAKAFSKDMEKPATASYQYSTTHGPMWSIFWDHHGLNIHTATNLTGLKEKMRKEIRRQRILFRRY